MTRWRQVNTVFEQALALADDQRDAFLETAAGDDLDLERMVRALLAADRSAGCFLQDTSEDASAYAGSAVASELKRPEARHIGPYRLLRPIGQGGMSTVYLAQRHDGFKREVALKLIRRDMESDEAERRLRSEREILAHLDHPYIARLYDGGTTEEGRPYFVMEHVEGERIDSFCDQQQLTLEGRLRLFLKILEAVHYAHQNLIVHRDLKPSNILVTAGGNPKLLDFGISKVLNAKLAAGDGGEAVVPWMRLLTPSYASPEQIRGASITTASDIYSLGVLLCKLLVGSVPHHFEQWTPQEVEQALSESPPPKPSVIVAAAPETSSELIARARRTTAARLRAQLEGDLDAIVTRAIQPAPQRRYDSVERLAEDVKSHLEGYPVLAHPDTFVYRTGKRLRRHAKTAAGGTVLAATLAILVGLLATQNLRLTEEREKVRQQRDVTDQVLAFTERILGHADPRAGQGVPWTVAKALRRSDPLIADELADSPRIRSQLHGTVGRIFRGLGESKAAIDHLEQALAIRQRLDGASSLGTAQALSDLAEAWVAAGDFAQGEALALQSVALYRERAGSPDPGFVAALNTYVYALCAEGDFGSADDASAEALDLARQVVGARDPELTRAMHNRARLLSQKDDVEGAEELYREVLAIRRTTLEEPHPSIASTQVNLASILERQGKHTEAAPLYQLALQQQRLLFGERHPDLAPTLNNLAVLHQTLGQWAKAEAAYRQAIDLFPEGDIHHLRFRTELASLLARTGRGEAAEALLRQELDDWRLKLPPGNTLIAWAENTLGAVLSEQLRLEEAEPLLTRSLPLIRERRGPNDAYTRKAERRLARLHELSEARAQLPRD
ncbi:MAG: serine/threonine-protein kinase [Acidobacteriota bacterium]